MNNSHNKIDIVRQSFRLDPQLDMGDDGHVLYSTVLDGISRNVKMGPFVATSGVILPYYLNASTNFMDKNIAPQIVRIVTHYLNNAIKPHMLACSGGESIVCCGMEVAGGMLVSQMAAASDSSLNDWMDFVYVRKDRKSTGTQQQLEGPQKFTSRTPNSPILYGVWLDDSLSTGMSMCDGIDMLREQYNIHIVAALYLVDRSKDRQDLPPEKQELMRLDFDTFVLRAVYDLQEVDQRINRNKLELN